MLMCAYEMHGRVVAATKETRLKFNEIQRHKNKRNWASNSKMRCISKIEKTKSSWKLVMKFRQVHLGGSLEMNIENS